MVYLSNGKIVKYIKKIKYNDNYLDILYTKKKGLMIKSLENTVMMGNIINGEINKMNHLEDITAIKLETSDKVLYEIYRLFYRNTPNFMDNNDRIRMYIMIYILNNYGIDLTNGNFKLYNDIPISLEELEIVKRLFLVNNIPDTSIRRDIKEKVILIGETMNREVSDVNELVNIAKYMYINSYKDNDKEYKIIKRINDSIK